MNDDTPDLGSVRGAWLGRREQTWEKDIDYWEAAFDRWLVEHDRAVAEKAWDDGNGPYSQQYPGRRNPHRKPVSSPKDADA